MKMSPSVFLTATLALSLTIPVQAQVSAPLGGGNGTPASAPSGAAPATLPNGTVALPDDYHLDTGDVVTIEVLRHGDVSRTVRIPADGTVRLARLTRPIVARGKTCADLIEEITGKLVTEGKLVLRPGQVNVSVNEMRIRRVFVRGNTGRSGDFDLKNGWRISELIAVSGGITQPERIKTRLLNPSRPMPITVKLDAALDNPESDANVVLQEGDTLVMEMPKNKRLFVKGEGPRGVHELDERFTLRQALVQVGFSPTGASGDLRHASLLRHTTPGDPSSPEKRIPVDLFTLLSDESSQDVTLEDMDTLDIPVSQRFIYIYGEISAPKKYYLPEDRKTYLVDVMSLGSTSGKAKIDDIKIWRMENNKPTVKSYKFGKFLANGDLNQNPEIQPQDVVMVPDVKRADAMSTVWNSWGIFGILQTLVPGIRPR